MPPLPSASTLAALDASLAAYPQLPRVTMLDAHYLKVITAAELGWISTTVADLKAGRLSWNATELAALASAQTASDDNMG